MKSRSVELRVWKWVHTQPVDALPFTAPFKEHLDIPFMVLFRPNIRVSPWQRCSLATQGVAGSYLLAFVLSWLKRQPQQIRGFPSMASCCLGNLIPDTNIWADWSAASSAGAFHQRIPRLGLPCCCCCYSTASRWMGWICKHSLGLAWLLIHCNPRWRTQRIRFFLLCPLHAYPLHLHECL